MRQAKNLKFKLCSEHKACSFCGAKNVPVVMEMRTGKAICDPCIQQVSGEMKHIGEHNGERRDAQEKKKQ